MDLHLGLQIVLPLVERVELVVAVVEEVAVVAAVVPFLSAGMGMELVEVVGTCSHLLAADWAQFGGEGGEDGEVGEGGEVGEDEEVGEGEEVEGVGKVGEDGKDGKVGTVEKAGFLDCEKLRSLNELLRVIWRQLGYFHQ